MNLYLIIQLVQLIIINIIIVIFGQVENDLNIYRQLLNFIIYYIIFINIINTVVFSISYFKNRLLLKMDNLFLLIIPGSFIILGFSIFYNFCYNIGLLWHKYYTYNLYSEILIMTLILAILYPLITIFVLFNRKINNILKIVSSIIFPLASIFLIYKLTDLNLP